MHRNLVNRLLIALLAFWGISATHAQIPGVPEPGLVLYGAVTNSSIGFPVSAGNVVWNFAGGGSSVTVTSTVVAVNNRFFYIAQVPFETRNVSGLPSLTATPNTLGLTAVPTVYTRSATVDDANATIIFSTSGSSGTFSFSRTNRGSVERVDLAAPFPNRLVTFAEFSLRFFGMSNVNPSADADGDSRSNYQEFLAGTDLTDSESQFLLDIKPAIGGGVTLLWSSTYNAVYTLERSSNFLTNFAAMRTNILATPPKTSFTDFSATNTGPYFYRLRANP